MTNPAVCADLLGRYTEALLLGRTPTPDVRRHVLTCARCGPGAEDARRVSATFAAARPLADPAPAETAARPSTAAARPGPALGARSRRHPPRWVLPAAAALLLGALVAAPLHGASRGEPGALAAPSSAGPGTPAPGEARTVRVVRDGRMVERSWGAEVPVVLSGLHVGTVYHLATEDGTGRTVTAGSLRARESTVRTRMTTAMDREHITALLVTDETGTALTRLPVDPPAAPSPSA